MICEHAVQHGSLFALFVIFLKILFAASAFFAVRWSLAEDNDESTVRNVRRKQFRKDYVGKGLSHQRRIVRGENAVLGVS